ncbi:uncharacterized protein [Macrobrachium rosenbergii]|uniref:uncharacterized protein isoform X1 n=1 Tax=Macrobrachium rosenbergii TaxID=79674 RepID=UPI0034D42455
MDRIIRYLPALLVVVACNAVTRCYNFNSTKDIHATVIICDDSCLKKLVKNAKNSQLITIFSSPPVLPGEEFLVQTCGPVVSKEEELQCQTGEINKIFEHTCLCRGEYCNSAAEPNVAFHFVLLVVVVFGLFA